MSVGSKAFKKKGEAFAAENRRRRSAAAAQKAAREALAYPDAPAGLTREALVLYHQSLREAFYRLQNERRANA